MRIAACISMFLIAGCGISVSTSGLRVGLIDDQVIEEDGVRVVTETVTGLKIDWAPHVTWSDVTEALNAK